MTKEEALTEWVMPAIRKTWNEKKCDEILKALAQEPCGKDINVPATDAISRQAVLEIVERVLSKGDAQFEIEQLPSVNPQEQKWIPVSERLPDTNDDVLVYDGADMFVAWYAHKGMWQGWNSHDNSFERDILIIAWMPSPEPFKAESEK